MNKTENISTKPSRAIWFWCVGSLAFLFLLAAIAIPLVQNYRAIKHVESLGGWVTTEPSSMFEALPDSWQEWLRSSLGEGIHDSQTVASIDWDDSSIKDDDLICLRRFTNLGILNIANTQITDDGLIHLKGLTNLWALIIYDTQITDDGLSHLRGLSNLRSLTISNTQISDDGLSHLRGLSNLSSLYISNTQITDTGLSHLKGFTNLIRLDVSNTQISKEGISQLQTALPDCEIKYSPASP